MQARQPQPDKHQELVECINRDGKINAAHHKVKQGDEKRRKVSASPPKDVLLHRRPSTGQQRPIDAGGKTSRCARVAFFYIFHGGECKLLDIPPNFSWFGSCSTTAKPRFLAVVIREGPRSADKMRNLVETEFLIRRIGQLWAQAGKLPARSPAQERVDALACDLSDYVWALHEKVLTSKAPERTPILNPWCEAEQG